MYRIEVAPGEETVFRTIEELAIGIRNGVITPRARIYHNASQKWLPIGLHPHYKKALDLPAANASPAPVTATTPMPSTTRPKSHVPSQPSTPVFDAPRPQPASPVARAPEPRHAPAPKPVAEPNPFAEPKPAPKASAAPSIRPPVQSAVIAMQNEVFRDLPMLHIPEPEPLPWQTPPRQTPPRAAAAPGATQAPTHASVEAPPKAPSAPSAAYAPPAESRPQERRTFEPEWVDTPAGRRIIAPRATERPAVRAVAPERPKAVPAAYVPLEYTGPVDEAGSPATEDGHAPRPTARRSRRVGGRPVMLLGVAAALVVGTHLVLTATPWASAGAGAAQTAEEPSAAPAAAGALEGGSTVMPAEDAPSPEARVTTSPARVRMTPGPAFSGSAPLRPGADTLAAVTTPRTASVAPAPAPAPADAGLAPAPIEMDLTLPDLPPDSVVPTARTSDTLGMKKILRALNGAKPVEASTPQ